MPARDEVSVYLPESTSSTLETRATGRWSMDSEPFMPLRGLPWAPRLTSAAMPAYESAPETGSFSAFTKRKPLWPQPLL